MKQALALVLELQEINNTLAKVEEKLKQKALSKDIFSKKKHKDELKEKILKLMDNLKSSQDIIGQMDKELAVLGDQLAELTNKLYSSTQSPKEAQSLESKVEELKKKNAEIEYQYYQALEANDELEQNIKQQKAAYKDSSNSLAKLITEFKGISNELAQKKEELVDKRNKLEGLIDKDLLTRYNQKRGQVLVVRVVNGNCGGCGMKLNFDQIKAMKKMEQLETCEYCGKILFIE
ncbi:MAG: C4-type zinc ribbon domain-containing protein [Bacillota bacterium]|nr:C4-type zinc ribbon domain-containing protein [Bacillota bacterium]